MLVMNFTIQPWTDGQIVSNHWIVGCTLSYPLDTYKFGEKKYILTVFKLF